MARPTRNAEPKSAAPQTGSSSPIEILTGEQVAARLQVPMSWIREKSLSRCPNPIPRRYIGRYSRYVWSEVLDWFLSLPIRGRAA
jgi:hypothetical protein